MSSLLSLGADIPMCLRSQTCRVRGVGEKVEFVELPPLPAVIINPRKPVNTPEVFAALGARDNPGMGQLPAFQKAEDLTDWLIDQRNDLQETAISIEPAIGEVLDELRGTRGCRLARMSGSGATCFGIFTGLRAALAAAYTIEEVYPTWWVRAGYLGDWSEQATPQFT